MFNESAVEALNLLIRDNTTIVLTTSHRFRFTIEEWIEIFKRRNVKIEKLDRLKEYNKRHEGIENFLSQVNEEFIIIDDDKMLNLLSEKLKKNLILTSPMIGLCKDNIAGRTNG